MNYLKIYENLISSRRNRTLESGMYYEKHHIIMRSHGGSDDAENLIYLTAREHFLAHRLLWAIYRDRNSALAFSMMKRGRDGKLNLSSREFGNIREALAESQRGENNHMHGKKPHSTFSRTGPHSEETKHKMSMVKSGHAVSEETRQKIGDLKRGKKNEKMKEIWEKRRNGEEKWPRFKNTMTEERKEKIRKTQAGKENLKMKKIWEERRAGLRPMPVRKPK